MSTRQEYYPSNSKTKVRYVIICVSETCFVIDGLNLGGPHSSFEVAVKAINDYDKKLEELEEFYSSIFKSGLD